ncbi:MAG: serine hydrolase, partial [Flavobacteriales bacterium]|nr:serine hydrolase [Flavobacteriales bacterium]
TYYDYIDSLILDPLGMENTGYRIDFQDDRLATGYMRDPQDPEAPLQPADPFTPIMGNSAGGGYSTLDDLYRFVKAFYAGELLDREGMVLTTTHFERSVGEMKGLLLGGGAPGANSIIDYDIDADLLIIVLSNYDPPGAEEAARTIRGLILKP